MSKFLVLIAAALAVSAQIGPPPRPDVGRRGRFGQQSAAQQPAGPPGIVRGQVLSVTGEPLRKAQVVLRSASGGPVLTATTDPSGAFVLVDVPPGNYAMSVERNGYVRQDYPQRAAARTAPAPVTVPPGGEVTGIRVKITPHSVVTGRVVDEDGDAVARQMVQVLRERWSRGHRELSPVGTDTTNDLGDYRVAGLGPGRYYVVVNAGRNFERGPSAVANRASGSTPEMGYTTTFYPNVIDPSQAAAIELTPGQEARGIDFQIRRVVTHRVRGKVVDLSGAAFRGVNIMVLPGDSAFGMSTRTMASVREDGSFELAGVPPGSYMLVVNRSGGEQRRPYASVHHVQVGNRDVDNLVLNLAPPGQITGILRVEGDVKVDLSRVRVGIETGPSSPFGASSQTVQPDGTFTMPLVVAGKHRLTVYGAPEGTYLKAVRQSGQEVPISAVPLMPGTTFEVVLGSNAATVTGTVVDANGKPVSGAYVALIPDGQRRTEYHLYSAATAADTGAFTFRNLTPGDYRVFAFAESQADQIQNPAFATQHESRATPVKLAEAKTETVQVTPIF